MTWFCTLHPCKHQTTLWLTNCSSAFVLQLAPWPIIAPLQIRSQQNARIFLSSLDYSVSTNDILRSMEMEVEHLHGSPTSNPFCYLPSCPRSRLPVMILPLTGLKLPRRAHVIWSWTQKSAMTQITAFSVLKTDDVNWPSSRRCKWIHRKRIGGGGLKWSQVASW